MLPRISSPMGIRVIKINRVIKVIRVIGVIKVDRFIKIVTHA